jgi:hypothetical protein
MTLIEMKQEISRLQNLAVSIRGLTLHNGAQHTMAIDLFNEINALNTAIKNYEEGRSLSAAVHIGQDVLHIAKDARNLLTTPSSEVHRRIEKIFQIINRMPKEASKNEIPLAVKYFEAGLGGVAV